MVDDGDTAADLDGDTAADLDGDTAADLDGDTAADLDGDSDGDWEFDLSDVGAAAEDDETLRPGSPKLEHVVFVSLGVLATLFAVFRVLFG